jgi:diguanylate cyclase (GGDEF)-like protein
MRSQDPKKRFSVLYVENDSDTFNLIKKSLEEDKYFSTRVDRAASVEECLKKLETRSYHLLLAESQIEHERGLELFEKLETLQRNIPFVLMTPVYDDQLVKEALKRGVADVIVKSEQHFRKLSSRLKESYQNYLSSRNRSADFDARLFQVSSVKRAGINSGKDDAVKLGVKDELTGLYSHSHFYDRIVREFASANRHQYPISCLVIDIDHFKAINEKWDYRIGDELLRECSELLFEHCRLSDFISRYGGEEFAILAPHVDYTGALELASRLRSVFAEYRFLKDSKDIQMTISIGIASFPEDNMEKRSELLNYAIQALFSSKASGRNRVTLYKEILPPSAKTNCRS